jgi:glycosyltransferase involved in cell wall biosynthesis
VSTRLAIIIPVYNGERFIEKAIRSIAFQTLQPNEIVVVNDGSTDRTSEILKGLDVPNLKVIEQDNTGVSLARNNGIKETNSEILAFMDVDDFWHAQKLEIQTNELNDRNYDLVYTDIVRVSEAETNIPEHSLIADVKSAVTETMPVEAIIYKPHLTTSSVMVKRKVFEAVGGFDETFKTAEDQVFYMDVVNEYKVGCIKLPLTYKRYVKNSLSSGIETYSDSLKALDRFEQQHPQSAIKYSSSIRKARARIYRDLGSELLWERKTSHALKPLLLSLKKYPSIDSFILLMKYILLSLVGKRVGR